MKIKWILTASFSIILLIMSLFSCSSQPSYVGKWHDSKDGGIDLEFTKDGHIVYGVPSHFDLGKYEPFGEEYVKISLEGEAGVFLRLAKADIWKLTVSGDSMVVEQGQILTLNFKRVR